MSVIAEPRDQRIQGLAVHEVHVDLGRLRSWDKADGGEVALESLALVRANLASHGLSDRSAARIASALARYAFLTEGGCDPSRRLLWRLYAVDGVTPDVLAQLTWDQVRIRLREVVAPAGSMTRYFALSDQTCRLLVAVRNDSRETRGSAHVFVTEERRPWDPESLTQVLAAISVR